MLGLDEPEPEPEPELEFEPLDDPADELEEEEPELVLLVELGELKGSVLGGGTKQLSADRLHPTRGLVACRGALRFH